MTYDWGTSAGRQGRGVVYYPGPRVIVTSHYIENAEGRYAIRDLGAVDRVLEGAYPAVSVALICGAIELGIAVPLALALRDGAAIMLAAGILIAIGVAAALIADGRRNPRWMALRAVHRGRMITLFRSRKHEEFEQVRRAVIRAVEANRRPRL